MPCTEFAARWLDIPTKYSQTLPFHYYSCSKQCYPKQVDTTSLLAARSMTKF
jgi:hypothetical protein